MIVYWGLFALAALLAVVPVWRPGAGLDRIISIALGVLLVVLIGLRFQVGGDWLTYERIFLEVNRVDLATALTLGDPLYNLLNWLIGSVGGDIWHVNLVCATIFTYGLIRFCRTLPYPAVGFVSAVPYLVIVVGMGFTRQATAIGCLMAAMASYKGQLNFRVLAAFIIALGFHKSVIFAALCFAFSSTRNRTANVVVGVFVIALLGAIFVFGSIDRFVDVYIESEMQSGGATIRLALSWLITFAYFIFLDRSGLLGERHKLWRNFGLVSLALIPIYFYSVSSTAVDRIGFLLLPFQLMVFGYLPLITRRLSALTYPLIAAIVGFNFALLYIWLFLADNAPFWLPYRNVLFEPYLHVF
jgi:hypothetical protein